MIRRAALGVLLALAACNRHGVADVTLAADAAQRNTTAAKTLADLAAADSASRRPLPVAASRPTRPNPAPAAGPSGTGDNATDDTTGEAGATANE